MLLFKQVLNDIARDRSTMGKCILISPATNELMYSGLFFSHAEEWSFN